MTRDDFLQAILDHPDDDAPRLVFADWLEEHGEPERAEFIRVQIELAILPNTDKRRLALEERETELLARNEEEWVRPIRDHVDSWTFPRGFIAEVGVTIEAYVKHTFELVGLAPIRRIWAEGMKVEIHASALELIPASIARENLVFPLGYITIDHHNCLLIATRSPIDLDLLQRLGWCLNGDIAPVEAASDQLEEAINRHYR